MGIDSLYHAFATHIERLQIGTDKFIHVQVGLAIWCLSAIVLKRPLSARLPLAICILAEVGNEILDRRYAGAWNWQDTAGDALATWFWPTLLFLLLRSGRLRGR